MRSVLVPIVIFSTRSGEAPLAATIEVLCLARNPVLFVK